MKTTNLICAFSLIAGIALVSCSKADTTNNPAGNQTATAGNTNGAVKEKPSSVSPGFADPAKLTEKAPDTFKAQFDTTKGQFTVEITRSLAPNGADRFYNLVKSGYFADLGFFRVVPGFMVQFGIHGDPAISAKWRAANIADDPVKGSNTRGTLTFVWGTGGLGGAGGVGGAGGDGGAGGVGGVGGSRWWSVRNSCLWTDHRIGLVPEFERRRWNWR